MPPTKKLLFAAAIFTVLATPGAAHEVSSARVTSPAADSSSSTVPSPITHPEDDSDSVIISGKAPISSSSAVQSREHLDVAAASEGKDPAATPQDASADRTPVATPSPSATPTSSQQATSDSIAPAPSTPAASSYPSNPSHGTKKPSTRIPDATAAPDSAAQTTSSAPDVQLLVVGDRNQPDSSTVDNLLHATASGSDASAAAAVSMEAQQFVQMSRGLVASQTLVVSERATSPELDRASYTVTVHPRYSYPVPPVGVPSGYGPRECDPGQPCSTFHEGLDFANAPGTPVKAVADGVVVFAGYDGNYGNVVHIEHNVDGDVFTTVSAHMEDYSLPVSAGAVVHRGDVIGSVGDTGRSYGAHLHFEVRYNNVAVHPGVWLDERAHPYPM